jgi:hypothetical protein
MLTLQDAIYGLRNLAVGDEEEVRIEDFLENIEPKDLRIACTNLVNQDKYVDAYEIAILPVLSGFTRDEIAEHTREWVREFVADQFGDDVADEAENNEEETELFDDIMSEYDRLLPAGSQVGPNDEGRLNRQQDYENGKLVRIEGHQGQMLDVSGRCTCDDDEGERCPVHPTQGREH